jgi:hypothetical protein
LGVDDVGVGEWIFHFLSFPCGTYTLSNIYGERKSKSKNPRFTLTDVIYRGLAYLVVATYWSPSSQGCGSSIVVLAPKASAVLAIVTEDLLPTYRA